MTYNTLKMNLIKAIRKQYQTNGSISEYSIEDINKCIKNGECDIREAIGLVTGIEIDHIDPELRLDYADYQLDYVRSGLKHPIILGIVSHEVIESDIDQLTKLLMSYYEIIARDITPFIKKGK